MTGMTRFPVSTVLRVCACAGETGDQGKPVIPVMCPVGNSSFEIGALPSASLLADVIADPARKASEAR